MTDVSDAALSCVVRRVNRYRCTAVTVIIQSNYAPSAVPKSTDVAGADQPSHAVADGLLDTHELSDGRRCRASGCTWTGSRYKTNFREPVMVRRAVDLPGSCCRWPRLSIDLRRVEPVAARRAAGRRGPRVTDAPPSAAPTADHGRVYLDAFKPWRDSLIWPFNRLFWQRAGRLGSARQPRLRGGAAERRLGRQSSRRRSPIRSATSGRCCATSTRAASCRRRSTPWRSASAPARARACGSTSSRRSTTSAAPATTRACASCSATTRRRRSRPRWPPSARTRRICSVHRDRRDESRSRRSSFLRFKILFVHLTNVYDNLSFDEIARRDGQLYHRRGAAVHQRRRGAAASPRSSG